MTSVRFFLSVTVLISAAQPAAADPMRVTGTFVFDWGPDEAIAELEADGLSLAFVGGFPPFGNCPITCQTGQSVDLDQVDRTLDFFANIDGFPDPIFPAALRFDIITGTVALGDALFSEAVPFTFSGVLTGSAGGASFERTLFGTGEAFAARRFVGAVPYAIYRFEAAPEAPIPEPATLALVGSCLTAAMVRRRRQSRRTQPAGDSCGCA
jgi:hypothetical protein